MLFKKKQSTPIGRNRQPLGRSANAKPVFSYHARAPRSDETGGPNIRRNTKVLWSNPVSPTPRQKPQPPKRLLVVVVALLVCILGVNGVLLSRDPKVIIVGANQPLLRSLSVYQTAAREALGRSFMNTTKLTINTDRIAQLLQDEFPEIQHVSVVLPAFGRQPKVYFEPARPALLLKDNQSRLFVLDPSGRAIMDVSQMATTADKLRLQLIEDQSGLPISLGHGVLPSDNMAFITEVIGQLSAKNLKISAMLLPPGASELDVRLEGVGYLVKFSLRGDARVEVGTFLAAKQHLDSGHTMPTSYVDVRVDNKVYYR